MSEILRQKSHYTSGWGDPAAMERRLVRTMCWTVVLMVAASAPFAPWRVTTGLLLGGALSLFNHQWLRTAIAAAFDTSALAPRPRISVARYILRYFIVAATVAAAYTLDIASIVAMLAGLCTFVVAVMLEASVQTYFAIIHREEN
ncbi:MAG TPA: ATP synthase subunit I [Pyrinomonadaceae bacterium]|jgi:hypothetical protein|nr:ATP synthase subunit I [Pyrinomonadaceae bacterium]